MAAAARGCAQVITSRSTSSRDRHFYTTIIIKGFEFEDIVLFDLLGYLTILAGFVKSPTASTVLPSAVESVKVDLSEISVFARQ